ncbi:BPSL0761 family protein [Geopseudomonas sagittaria]|uniref:BPSL0761 family protein n=1 Tax=Geopseudomonas sagittaria TaxID=1135990 RepID=UPI003183270D
MVELSRDCRLPNEIRCEARRLLRHYPSKSDLHIASRLEEKNPLRVEPVFESPDDASVN